jgi:alpha-tubulin suppressor-like RCC1 family protein
LALRLDGSVWAWGANTSGQLGNGAQGTSPVPLPVRVTGLPAIKAIAAGGSHSLALGVNGQVWAWGLNSAGQLGDGTTTLRLAPVAVTIPGGAVAIAAGNAHSLAVATDGSVYAWGSNASGQLGDGTTALRHTPVRINLPVGVRAVSAGQHHSMALGANGSVWTWGRNVSGQIGSGNTSAPYQLTPYSVSLGQGATAIAAGGTHSMALLSNQKVMVWGSNVYGQLGNGTTATAQPVPVQSGLAAPAAAISAGADFSLAIDSSGAVWSWGRNTSGQLGDGTIAQRTSPVPVVGLTDAVAISAGGFHVLALRPDCPFWAWGANDKGQLGDGTVTGRRTVTQSQLVNIYFFDNDGDGYGEEFLSPVEACESPDPEYVENRLDCDDFDDLSHPGATEVCNGVDDNCSGTADEGNPGGAVSCSTGTPGVCAQGVTSCTGGALRCAPIQGPSAEVCDGLDNNCDGRTDETGGQSTFYRDADGDGKGSPSVTTQACTAPAGYVANSQDCNDADPSLPRSFIPDADRDGYGAAFVAGPAPPPPYGCTAPAGYTTNSLDCDDTRSSVRPGAPEVCDGLDNNCNGSTDEGATPLTWYRDADGDGKGNSAVTTQACTPPAGYVRDSSDCNDSNASLPAYFSRDGDGDGYGDVFVVSPATYGCSGPAGYVPNTSDCHDGSKFVYPGALEVCDGMDNNCNGTVDDSCSQVTCSAYFSSSSIPSGGTGTFGYTSSGPLADSRAYLYGSRDWVQDANGSDSYDQTTFSYLVGNYPGLEGYYQRYVVIRRSDGADLCTTNTVAARFLPP